MLTIEVSVDVGSAFEGRISVRVAIKDGHACLPDCLRIYATLCKGTTACAEASNSFAIGIQFGGGFDATPRRLLLVFGIDYGEGLAGGLDLSHTMSDPSFWTLGLNFGVGAGASFAILNGECHFGTQSIPDSKFPKLSPPEVHCNF